MKILCFDTHTDSSSTPVTIPNTDPDGRDIMPMKYWFAAQRCCSWSPEEMLICLCSCSNITLHYITNITF